jgi:hypothetical protein
MPRGKSEESFSDSRSALSEFSLDAKADALAVLQETDNFEKIVRARGLRVGPSIRIRLFEGICVASAAFAKRGF